MDHTVETAAEFRRLDFLRIAWTHRRHPIGEKYSAFEQADLRVVFDAVDVIKFFRQIRAGKRRSGEKPLVGDVVNRKNSLQRQRCAMPPLRLTHEQRNQRRLPIMRVNNISLQIR